MIRTKIRLRPRSLVAVLLLTSGMALGLTPFALGETTLDTRCGEARMFFVSKTDADPWDMAAHLEPNANAVAGYIECENDVVVKIRSRQVGFVVTRLRDGGEVDSFLRTGSGFIITGTDPEASIGQVIREFIDLLPRDPGSELTPPMRYAKEGYGTCHTDPGCAPPAQCSCQLHFDCDCSPVPCPSCRIEWDPPPPPPCGYVGQLECF